MLSRRFEFLVKPSGLIIAIPVDAIEWIDPAPEAATAPPTSSPSPEARSPTKAATKPTRRRARLRPTLRQARGDIRW